MSGSATFTIVMSSSSMNVARQTASRVHHLRSIADSLRGGPARPGSYASSEPRSLGTSTACSRSASSGTMSSARSCVEASTTYAAAPSRCARSQLTRGDAPAIAGHEAGEAVQRHRRREVVADRALVLEELRRDDGADRVAAEVLGAGAAAAVAVEASQRVGPAGLELASEDVAIRHARSMSEARCQQRTRPKNTTNGPDRSVGAAAGSAFVARLDAVGAPVAARELRRSAAM